MTNNTKTPNVGNQDWENKVKKIAEAIGSPYGEGATYDRGSSPSHLDVSDKAELIEDILKLLTQQEEELRRGLVGEVEKLKRKESYSKYCGCDGECFAACDASFNVGIDGVLKILKKEDKK